ncbi:MAG: peptidoglycan-associated lipoprotein Pal [Proteobacteria bacterium]|nr:peptidoglycan-associated lipoprotein Pal [Pseudomonadota bacterium]MCL2308189.1 peptidoglycan-associated lipoprotein Pal [Pseudomonadota bacterium]
MTHLLKYGFLVFVAVALAACSSTPSDEGAPVDDRTVASGGTADGAGTSGAGGTGVTGADVDGRVTHELKDPANILSRRGVFFAFDSYVVEDQYRPLVEAHARYLVRHPDARMTLQGHADERGTHEYNLALGQRRADAVKRMMLLLGAKEAQIETVSFGKEKPRNPGHDETAWAENRRVDIVYAGE